jgi:hypothetical protein
MSVTQISAVSSGKRRHFSVAPPEAEKKSRMSSTPADFDLTSDPRWRRLWDRPWTCSQCNEMHHGLFDPLLCIYSRTESENFLLSATGF